MFRQLTYDFQAEIQEIQETSYPAMFNRDDVFESDWWASCIMPKGPITQIEKAIPVMQMWDGVDGLGDRAGQGVAG